MFYRVSYRSQPILLPRAPHLMMGAHRQHRRQETTKPAAAAAAAAPAATSSLWSALTNSLNASSGSSSLAALLTSSGIFLLCCAGAIFLLATIPAVWAMARAARRIESVMMTVEKELPDTMATMRLSGLEISECISEITGLGSDLSGGIRSTAQLATMAESTIKQGAQVVDLTVKKAVPQLTKKKAKARAAFAVALQERAALPYGQDVREYIQDATVLVKRVRSGVWVAGAAMSILQTGQMIKQRMEPLIEMRRRASESAKAAAELEALGLQ